jgi:Golgi apparatus protein 1
LSVYDFYQRNFLDDDAEKNVEQNEKDNGQPVDREMGGRIIQCLRTKYIDTSVTLTAQCVTELIDVIQTSKLNVKLDLKLYRSCQNLFTSQCTGIDQEDCLKLLYQKGQVEDGDCKEQIKRIIREGQADIHVDRALAFACQADVLKYCNEIPIGKLNFKRKQKTV